jgi:hypothetical protein
MMTLRNWTLRVLSPLLVGGFGLLTTTGCPLPKQLDQEEGDCDDGNDEGAEMGDTLRAGRPELRALGRRVRARRPDVRRRGVRPDEPGRHRL